MDNDPLTDDLIVLKNPTKKYSIIALRGTNFDEIEDLKANLDLANNSKPSLQRDCKFNKKWLTKSKKMK